MGEQENRGGSARGPCDDADFCELAHAVGLARRRAGFVGVGLVIGRIVGRYEIGDRDYGLLWEDFVRFFFSDVVCFGAGNDFEVTGDGGDADFARGEDGDLAGGGGVALRCDANVGGDDFDAVGVVAAKGEGAVAKFGDGPFSRVRGVEAAEGAGGEAIAGVRDADVGRAANVGADFFAGENARAFGEGALADMSEIRLEHDAKWCVLRG